MAMPIVHRDEIVRENATAFGSVFKSYADVISVFDSGKSVLCFCVVEEAVMVAFDKDNLSVESSDELLGLTVSAFPNHVAEDIDEISFTDFGIPPPDKFFVHFFYSLERSVVETDCVFVTKVEVTCKEYFSHAYLLTEIPTGEFISFRIAEGTKSVYVFGS